MDYVSSITVDRCKTLWDLKVAASDEEPFTRESFLNLALAQFQEFKDLNESESEAHLRKGFVFNGKISRNFWVLSELSLKEEYNTAKKCFRMGAFLGDIDAKVLLGKMYITNLTLFNMAQKRTGLIEKAKRLFTEAQEQLDIEMQKSGNCQPSKLQMRVSKLLESLEKTEARSSSTQSSLTLPEPIQNAITRDLCFGEYQKKLSNYKRLKTSPDVAQPYFAYAQENLTKAADLGHVEASKIAGTKLKDYYWDGKSPEQKELYYQKVNQYLDLASSNGDSEAAFELGKFHHALMHLPNPPATDHKEKAIQYFSQAYKGGLKHVLPQLQLLDPVQYPSPPAKSQTSSYVPVVKEVRVVPPQEKCWGGKVAHEGKQLDGYIQEWVKTQNPFKCFSHGPGRYGVCEFEKISQSFLFELRRDLPNLKLTVPLIKNKLERAILKHAGLIKGEE